MVDRLGDVVTPVFVVGTPRSGTTLMARILGSHPDLFMPGETHFFDDIYSRRDELGDPEDQIGRSRIVSRLSDLYGRYNEFTDQERVDRLFSERDPTDRLKHCRSYAEVLTSFMDMQMKSVGKRRWGNNVPSDLFNYADILDFYPDARFVVCIRDIRAFLLSYKNKWRSAIEPDRRARVRRLYHPVITSLLWKSSMRLLPLLCKRVAPERIVCVPYERLVADTEATIRRVCDVAGLDYVPEMLNIDFHNSSSSPSDKGIFTSSVDRWRVELSAEEIAIAQRIGGGELTRLGYTVEPVTPNYLRLAALVAATPVALWRGLAANKDIRGPLVPYLSRRAVSLLRRPVRKSRSL